MKHRTANCPACGGPVEFKTGSSLVTVCEFCDSVIARGDKKVEDYGKVADLGETNSGMRLGLEGKFNHKSFFVSGRVRYQHPAGGVWDEWYLALPGERWGWLAEAQGNFYLLFERNLTSRTELPEFNSLTISSPVTLGKTKFSVREKGIATGLSAEGEIPWAFRPGCEHKFVDLENEEGVFATLEYGASPAAFVGKQVTLEQLGIDTSDDHPDNDSLPVAALHLNCPKCGGSLILRAPDQTERVTCRNCDSLLDAAGGKLAYFSTLRRQKITPLIPIGRAGKIAGVEYTVIGFMERFATYEGTKYPWTEYLLYNHKIGFRWLVCNQSHWSFVEPVKISDTPAMDRISYDGSSFRIYDRGTAYVRYVLGEFYWRVSEGDYVGTADFIAPPRMLSFEWTKTAKLEEINVSLGTYMQHEEIEAAFGVKGLPRSWGVGPISPAPAVGPAIYVAWMAFSLVMLLIHAMYYTGAATTGSDGWLLFYGLAFLAVPPVGIMFYRHGFEVQRWSNSDYSPYASSE